MKGKDIATGHARDEELDPLRAARTTSVGNDRGSQSNPLKAWKSFANCGCKETSPLMEKSSLTHAKYVHSLSMASDSVRRIIDRYKIKSYF